MATSIRTGESSDTSWWRRAVVYQIYPRSFADASGDGIGDIAGIRAHVAYLADLGVDAVWINPWYPSPMKDAGYDVSDYRDIEPVFGTLAEAEALLAEAKAAGLRVMLDIVPNHTSDKHRFFQEALAAGPGSPERDRFYFREGRGDHGELPPNDWQSEFGGPAWTRVTEAEGTPGQWYLRIFAAEQPDVNWNHPDIVAEFDETLRFWFDRGVDGFRIDVAHGLSRTPGCATSRACRSPCRTTPLRASNIPTGTSRASTRCSGTGVRSPTRTIRRAPTAARSGSDETTGSPPI